MPELRHLRAFVAVAEERNFTRAAQRLHLAQQAVSKTVAQLEAELGVALLERTPREVRPTAAGAALQAEAGEVLARADAAFARASAQGRGLEGRITVGLTGAVGGATVAPAISAVRREAPGLSIALFDVRPGDVADCLRGRQADVALVRSGPRAEGLDVRDLAPTPAALFVPEDHALAGLEEVTLDRLDGEQLLVWSAPGTPYTDLLLARCAEAGVRVTPVETAITGGGSGLLELADLGAVSISPEGHPAPAGVVAVPLAGVSLPLRAVRLPGPAVAGVERLVAALGG